MDTSGEGVKLSCCEHYENVLFAYTDNDITAVNNFNAILFLPTPISLSHLLVLLIDCELFVPAFFHFIVYSDRLGRISPKKFGSSDRHLENCRGSHN